MTDKHFSNHFENELHAVSAHLTELGQQVDDQVSKTIEALSHFDAKEAQRALDAAVIVNGLESNIDREVTSIVARWQPAARDLRLLMAVSKASSGLARVGNEANKMSHKVVKLISNSAMRVSLPDELFELTRLTTGLLHAALNAFSRQDLAAAMAVMKSDKLIYEEIDSLIHQLVTKMIETPHTISVCVELITLTKSHELIMEHAKHIAELVFYVVKAADIHHTPSSQIEPLVE